MPTTIAADSPDVAEGRPVTSSDGSVDQRKQAADFLVASRGDERGFHLYVARDPEWEWRTLATISNDGFDGWPWTGYHCVTGDGRHAVVVAAPVWFTNRNSLRDREAFVYRVDIATGEVEPLIAGAALKYYNPGCGVGPEVALVRHLGTDQERSEILVIDLEKGDVSQRITAPGQVTSAVPVKGAIAAARDKGVVYLNSHGERTVASTPGMPYRLRASPSGVDFLVARPNERAEVWHASRDEAKVVATGRLGEVSLYEGRNGKNILLGDEKATRNVDNSRLRTVRHEGTPPRFVSHQGTAFASDPSYAADGSVDERTVEVVGKGAQERPLPESGSAKNTPLPPRVSESSTEGGDGGSGSSRVLGSVVGELSLLAHHSPGGPGCAIPRNVLTRQVPQPDAEQVDWAIQQATRNLLKGSVLTRPANYANTGAPSYQPSNDFQRHPLSGDSGAPVPPSVIQGTYAQESNFRQASWRALPGVPGNPLVADFYGAMGTLDQINYGQADCGYGLSQVTHPMRADSHTYSMNGKIKVAVDYAENVAAGIQFLVSKWNQLYTAGIIANNGSPSLLENWYMALWAYNSGVQPEGLGCTPSPSCHDGNGNWGLGWTNNPIQADYPPDRQPFLRTTYADAEHPSDWPYQERVMGWMETPQLDYTGSPSYAKPLYVPGAPQWISLPDRTTFCTQDNECDPDYENGSLSYCTRTDRHCWWHEPVTWAAGCPNSCATSLFTLSPTATEPSGADNYPPNCNEYPGATAYGAAIIVDNQPSNINVAGCSSVSWTSQGSFSIEYGKNQSGVELGQIDFHQLGTGFGGHTWFTKNRLSADVAHINTATWDPGAALTAGTYLINAHVPPSGASTSSAKYKIHRGDGSVDERVVNQHLHENRWIPVGRFELQPGAKVVLTNVTDEPSGGMANVAFDALAFIPVGGSPTSVVIDAVQIFDPDQNIDTSGSYVVNSPFESEAALVAWATKLIDGDLTTEGVLSYPPCAIGFNDQCVGLETRQAFAVWGQQVRGLPPLLPPETPADWMRFTNSRPPSLLPAGYLDDLGGFKQHTRLVIEYEVANGAIDLSTVSVFDQHRAGHTLMPQFLIDFMSGIEADYGVSVPNLTYSAENLTVYTHQVSSAEPHVDGVLPGRQFRSYVSSPEPEGACVSLEAVSGGIIGWKPMLNEGAVSGPFQVWKDEIASLANNEILPDAVAEAADEVYKVMFSNQWSWGSGYVGSPFRWAPPIWLELSAKVCPDGSVSAIGPQLGDGSFMPDLYLYVNGEAADQQGAPQPSGDPILTGDFERFSREWRPPPFTWPTQWGPCDFAEHRRAGNPWTIRLLPLDKQSKGDNVKLCSGTPTSPH